MTPCSFFHSEPFKQLTCADEATLSALLVRAVCERWSNHLSRVFSCSWVRTLSTAPSCWTSATRRLWRRQSTTASSSATWTWSRWTTATYTTATTSRDTSPSQWTSLASGEVIGKHSAWPLSTCFCLHLPQWGLKLWRTSAYLNAGYRLLDLPKSVCFCVWANLFCKICRIWICILLSRTEMAYSLCCDRQFTAPNLTKSHYTLKSLSEAKISIKLHHSSMLPIFIWSYFGSPNKSTWHKV